MAGSFLRRGSADDYFNMEKFVGGNPAGTKYGKVCWRKPRRDKSFSSMAHRPALHITRLRDVAWKLMNYRVVEFILKTLQGMRLLNA